MFWLGIKKTLLYQAVDITPMGEIEIDLKDDISNYSFYEIIFAPDYVNILRASSGIIQITSPVQTISVSAIDDDSGILIFRRNFIPNGNKMKVGKRKNM